MKLRIARRAFADLDEINAESRRRWGQSQTRRYIAAINLLIERLCETPYQFPALVDRPTHRKARSGQHLIIYRVDPDAGALNVVRILHERMDIETQLS